MVERDTIYSMLSRERGPYVCCAASPLVQYGQCFIQVTDPRRHAGGNHRPRGLCQEPVHAPGGTCASSPPSTAPCATRGTQWCCPEGAQSHCSEASGSDLDGDIYFCAWHPGLVRGEGE